MELLSLKIGNTQIDTPGNVPSGGIEKGEEIIQNSIEILLIVAIIFSLFMLVWGGISWITSGGDKTKVENARKKLTFAIIGLVVALLSFFLISLVGTLFGVQLFSNS